MNYQHLLEQARDYALAFYKTHDTANLLYHNQTHTEDVVSAATKIANHYQLGDEDFFILIGAVWFHDLGYMIDINNHEDKGIELAQEFFHQHNVGQKLIDQISGCIAATKMPQSPTNLLERIICDADLFHLGTDRFEEKDKLLRKEINLLHGSGISKEEWHKKSIHFLETQNYHTDYCRLLLNATKQKNLDEVKKKVTEEEAKEEEKVQKAEAKERKKEQKALAESDAINYDVTIVDEDKLPVKNDEEKKEKKQKNNAKPEKGIETMFRISSSNHQRLSDMADNKAHIMITVNSIILSAVLSLLLRHLNQYEYLLIPTAILLMVSLLAMTFSILSTRPSIPPGTFTRADVDEKKVNLLFFGNFYKMPLAEYDYGMQKMMLEKDFLYGSLIRDVYAQGVVLGKKYRLLRIAYNIFMFGLIIAVVAFVIAAAFFGNDVAPVAVK